jgi:hypothetical protein
MKKNVFCMLLLIVFVIAGYAVTTPEMVLMTKGDFMMWEPKRNF